MRDLPLKVVIEMAMDECDEDGQVDVKSLRRNLKDMATQASTTGTFAPINPPKTLVRKTKWACGCQSLDECDESCK